MVDSSDARLPDFEKIVVWRCLWLCFPRQFLVICSSNLNPKPPRPSTLDPIPQVPNRLTQALQPKLQKLGPQKVQRAPRSPGHVHCFDENMAGGGGGSKNKHIHIHIYIYIHTDIYNLYIYLCSAFSVFRVRGVTNVGA